MRAEHNIDIHGGEHFGGKYNHTISTLSANIWFCMCIIGSLKFVRNYTLGCNLIRSLVKWKKANTCNEGTYQCPVFCSKITSRTLLSCKSVNIYFLPLTFQLEIWVKVTKNRRIFFPPTKGVPIIIESSTDKNNRKKSERFKFAT